MNFESRRIVASVTAALWLSLAAAAAAKDTGVKFERGADFSQYRTFGWSEPLAKPEGSPLAAGGQLDVKIRNAIERQLRAQGFEPAVEGDPDFLVSFDGAMEGVASSDAMHRDIRPGIAWVMEGSVSSFNRGTLIITVRDGGDNKVVWSAWTTEKVKDPGNPGKQVDRAVRKLLKKFPPR